MTINKQNLQIMQVIIKNIIRYLYETKPYKHIVFDRVGMKALSETTLAVLSLCSQA